MNMTPRNEQELAEAVQDAKSPLRVVGGGTRDVGRPVDGAPLEVEIAGIDLYEPGALTLVVGAGTPLAEVEAVLAAEGQRLPFEPMDHRPLLGTTGTPTIGAVIAGNVSGPRRVQVGAARDFLLGVRFVDGRGQILQNGGRVMKNVTGYDLARLMAGSWGTLGVLSQVSLKVLAIPEAEATLVARGVDARAGIGMLARGLGSPFEVTGAAHVSGETLLRIEGLADSVAYRAAALRAYLGGDWDLLEGAASAARWRDIRDVVPLARAPVVWRLSVKPSDAPEISAALTAGGLAHDALYDWGGGLMWIAPEAAPDDGGEALIRGQIAGRGGHARLEKAPADLRAKVAVFQPETGALARISREIKQKFDPRGILNPGLTGV